MKTGFAGVLGLLVRTMHRVDADPFSLHDRFKDKGLVIVGIHIDVVGDVQDAATLDKKIAKYRKESWKSRDLPFSVGLFQGTIKGDENSPRKIA